MYNRARYYDPATGEFISRDPLEYVDGMSLYRGYFVPVGVDPMGTTCEKKCGVETMSVVWDAPKPAGDSINTPGGPVPIFRGLSLANTGTAFILKIVIIFKKDDEHDPAKCEFSQDAGVEVNQFLRSSGLLGLGRTPGSNTSSPFSDDGYSRRRNVYLPGRDDYSDPFFATVDAPGFGAGVGGNGVLGYRFMFQARQMVTDIDSGQVVAKTTITTGVVSGPDPIRRSAGVGSGQQFVDRVVERWDVEKFHAGLGSLPYNAPVRIFNP